MTNYWLSEFKEMKKPVSKNTNSNDVDVESIKMMIIHHKDAIEMSKHVVSMGKNAAVRTIAEGIITAQDAEIIQMKKLLTTL